jgi:pSer/pThr/pTyr-binding forkhead associated (FHA) protein
MSRLYPTDFRASMAIVSEENEAEGPRIRPPSGGMALVLTGFYEGLEFPLDRDRIVIGRGRKADLALAEATISRAHAAIGFDGGQFFVEDLGSTNGTLVNGAPVARQSLKNDDEIQMGKLRIGVTLPL